MSNNNLNTETSKEVVQADKKSIVSILKSWKFILVVFLILISILGYWLISNTNLINNYADKVYPGAYILNKDLAGLDNNDLHSTLISLVEDISNKKVNVEANEQNFEISYKDLEATINYEKLEDDILSFGKNEGFFRKINLIKKPENREYGFEVLFNEEKLTSFVSSISNTVDVSPTNASIDISGGAINISNDSTGLKLNSTDLIDKIKSQIKDMKAPNVVEVTGNVNLIIYIT